MRAKGGQLVGLERFHRLGYGLLDRSSLGGGLRQVAQCPYSPLGEGLLRQFSDRMKEPRYLAAVVTDGAEREGEEGFLEITLAV